MRADRELAVVGESVQEWLDSVAVLEVKALIVLGPASADDVQRRGVWVAHPGSFRAAAEMLAPSDVYGAAWRASGAPTLAWQNIRQDSEAAWQAALASDRIRAIVRCDVPMPFGAGFECLACVSRPLAKPEAFEIGWALVNAWPGLKDGVIASRFGVTPRMREVLRVLAEGHTAETAAQRLGMKERTVGYHLNVVMEKLNARNRAAAILRACILGIL